MSVLENQNRSEGIFEAMLTASIALLLAFTIVASIDGFYFHLFRYRLYARAGCRLEHLLHSINAVLFPATLAPLYLARASGAWLVAAVLLCVLTVAVESLDVFMERNSRAVIGGLTSSEYWMHFIMSGLRWACLALAFAAIPRQAWSDPTSWSWLLPRVGTPLRFIPWSIFLLGIGVAWLHVQLAWRGRPATGRGL